MMRPAQEGYTLLELLIVILIIALTLSVVLLRMPSTQFASQRAAAQQIQGLVELARERSILHTTVLGMTVTPQEIHYDELVGNTNENTQPVWQPYLVQNKYWHVVVQPPLAFTLQTEQTNNADSLGATAGENPQVIFWPTGEMTPFVLKVYSENSPQIYQVMGSKTGEVKLEQQNEPQ